MVSVTINKGDSWSYEGTIQIDNNLDLSSWSIISSLVGIEKVYATFNTSWVPGKFNTFSHKLNSTELAAVPLGTYSFNVRFTSPAGDSLSSDTIIMNIDRGIN